MQKDSLSTFEKKAIKKLVETGMKKKVAITLVYTMSKNKVTSREIEDATDLRQPEVSMATRELRDKDWMKKEKESPKGAGRPIHLYSIKLTPKEIFNEIKKKENKKITEIKKTIKELTEIAEKLENE